MGDDYTWNINGRAYNGSDWINGAPAALLRGGRWGGGTEVGVFTVNANHAPSNRNDNFGFRCAR